MKTPQIRLPPFFQCRLLLLRKMLLPARRQCPGNVLFVRSRSQENIHFREKDGLGVTVTYLVGERENALIWNLKFVSDRDR